MKKQWVILWLCLTLTLEVVTKPSQKTDSSKQLSIAMESEICHKCIIVSSATWTKLRLSSCYSGAFLVKCTLCITGEIFFLNKTNCFLC